jgi:threonine/homoserine/homoserine lactone efflux protein
MAVATALARNRRVLLEGFVVGLTNPKMIVFLAAALPQFVNRGAGQVTLQMLLLGLLVAPSRSARTVSGHSLPARRAPGSPILHAASRC